MKSEHIVISGTGRAGTSFLVQLLTEIGQDTGFAKGMELHPDSRAGLEHDMRKGGRLPYWVKDPAFCYYADWAFENYTIKKVVIPVRSLDSAAQSRRNIHLLNKEIDPLTPTHGGGLFGSMEPQLQEAALSMAQYRLIHSCVRHGVPMVFLCYEKMMVMNGWLYIGAMLKDDICGNAGVLRPMFNLDLMNAFTKLYKPEWVK